MKLGPGDTGPERKGHRDFGPPEGIGPGDTGSSTGLVDIGLPGLEGIDPEDTGPEGTGPEDTGLVGIALTGPGGTGPTCPAAQLFQTHLVQAPGARTGFGAQVQTARKGSGPPSDAWPRPLVGRTPPRSPRESP